MYKFSPPVQGDVVLPVGIPPATIGGSKEGIVLRDSVSLDAYQQKLREMTKAWPQFAVNAGGAAANRFQSQQVTNSFPAAGQTAAGFTSSIDQLAAELRAAETRLRGEGGHDGAAARLQEHADSDQACAGFPSAGERCPYTPRADGPRVPLD